MSLLFFWQSAGGPTIVEADGASAGAATVSGIAAAVFAGVGSADGLSTTSGVAAAVWLSDASAAGIASVTGEANALWASTGSADGSAIAIGETEYVGSGESAPAPAATVTGGRATPRKRYLLPNDELVWARPDEIQAILEQFVEVEQPKPLTKRQKRRSKAERLFEPVKWEAIRYEPIADMSVQTFRAVLPPTVVWRPDLEALAFEIQKLKRRIDDEEAILLLL